MVQEDTTVDGSIDGKKKLWIEGSIFIRLDAFATLGACDAILTSKAQMHFL